MSYFVAKLTPAQLREQERIEAEHVTTALANILRSYHARWARRRRRDIHRHRVYLATGAL